MNNLFLFMSLTGSIAFILYLIFRFIFHLGPSNRYFLLKITMAFFLLPIPLLTVKITEMIRWLFQDETLLSYKFHKIEYIDTTKTVFLTPDGIVLPFEFYPLYLKLLFIIVIVFFAVIIFIQFSGYRKFKKLMAEAENATPDYERLLEETKKELSLHRHITFKKADIPCSSFTCGLLHPIVVITSDSSIDDIYYILKHELYHIKSLDFLFRILSAAVVILHFYNPIAWLFFFELGRVCELYCDAKVLRNVPPEVRKKYGHLLIEQSAFATPLHYAYVRTFSSPNKKIMKERILMSQKKPRRKYLVTVLAAFITLTVSASPVLAYELPAVSEWHESRDELLSNGEFYFVFDEPLFPEDENLFKECDTYFIDQNGEITVFSNLDFHIQRKACTHNYKSGQLKKHTKSKNGSCTVKVYNGKMCTKCHNKLYGQLISSHSYTKCLH